MRTIQINGSRPYPVLIEDGLMQHAGEALRSLFAPCRAALIADDTVAALFGQTVSQSLNDNGFPAELISFPHGEKNKTPQTLFSLLNALAERQLTRSDLVIALGGGVTGDMAGLCAALYLRGVRCVQMPTTLLAAVDSSVGGKTAVDLPRGKNLVGAFWPPAAILCDTQVLGALPSELTRDGMAEMLKYGLLCDEALFASLASGQWKTHLPDTVARCIEIKKAFVEQDEHDRGLRQMLNLGHTFGHAVECCSGFTWTHGQAVGLGLVMACRAARMPETDKVIAAVHAAGLPVACPFPVQALYDAALRDKKRNADQITLVLPKKIGECTLQPVPVQTLPTWFEKALNA